MLVFHFLRHRRQQPKPVAPEWVRCHLCDLEILLADAETVSDADNGVHRNDAYQHQNRSCQKPFYREREIGLIRKPPLARLPIW